MADALCGPSNPLQSFKSHTQVDRTLQQDRFAGARHSLGQDFRTPDPRAGLVEAQLTAFEAGPQEPFHLQQQHLSPFSRPSPIQGPLPSHQQRHATSAPQWAADFQRLQLASVPTQPTLQDHFRSEAPMARSTVAEANVAWHEDFKRQEHYFANNINGKQAVQSEMVDLGYIQSHPLSQHQFAHQQPGFYQNSHYPPEEGVHQNTSMDYTDEAAFEAAFAQAEDSHTFTQEESHQDVSNPGEIAGVRLDPILGDRVTATHLSNNLSQNSTLEQQQTIRIGSDAIPDSDRTAPKTYDQLTRDGDELARTAGQLLHSVSADTSTKFEQSQFLALMRRIRDREVEVHGEEFRETTQDVGDVQAGGLQSPSLQPSLARSGDGGSSSNHQLELELEVLEAENNARLRRYYEQDREQRMVGEERGRQEEEEEEERVAQPLHPGGREYPLLGQGVETKEDPHRYDHWASGGLAAEDVDEMVEEDVGLAGRFRKVSLRDGMEGR